MLATDLFASAIGPAFQGIKDLISEFHMSPEEKTKAQEAIASAQQQAQDAARDYEVKLNEIAGQNIRSDAASADRFTQRARPMFMYIVEAVLAFNFIGLPLAKVFGSRVDPIVLPADLLTLFGVCITGYVMSRSVEKVSSLPGDSSVKLPFVSVSNKS